MSSQSSSLIHANNASEAVSLGAGKSSNDTVRSRCASQSAKLPLDSPKVSKNPYRQNLTTSAPTLQLSASEETHNSVPGRVKPVRAVFDDLPTAHSSITSGTARSRSRRLSNNLSEAYEEEDSIPLQEFEPPKRRNAGAQSFLDELPLPPPRAAIVQHRYNSHSHRSDSCLHTEDDKFTSYQLEKDSKLTLPGESLGQPNSLFANVKSVFTPVSSPTPVSTPSNRSGKCREKGKQCVQYPENSSSIYHSGLGAAQSGSLPPNSAENKPLLDPPQKHCYDSYDETIPFPNLQSTPAPNEGSSSLPRQSSKTTRVLSNAASSLPEGSTVGNIYKHYARSDPPEDFDSDSNDARSEHGSPDGYQISQRPCKSYGLSQEFYHQTALHTRKQRRAEHAPSSPQGQPPGCSLPIIPNPSARILPSSSQGIVNSSSYGDTHNLLELTVRSHWIGHKPALSHSNARSNLRSDQASSGYGSSSQPSIPYLSPNNPFRVNRLPQVLVSQANDEDYTYKDHHNYHHAADRQPLEREVSEALRRASNFSTYSNGSIATSVLEHYGQFQSDASSSNGMGLLRRYIEYSPPSDSELVDEEMRAAEAHAQAFYEKGSIPSNNWVAAHHHNVVRIPIKQNEQLRNSPLISPQDPIELVYQSRGNITEPGDDGNDWETVGESASGTDFKGSTPGMLGGGMANRAGSSIANTSDEGSACAHIPEISNYGSTERIAQHPGNIEYFGDYRQRDLKNTHIPVFLPVFREHKVNGYLADSNRTRPPPNPFDYNPTPLSRKHNNPFNSPPPEVMRVAAGKPYTTLNRDQRAAKPNHFPTSTSIKTCTSSQKSQISEEHVPSFTRPAAAAESSSEPFNWMDDFGEPGPEIKHSKSHFLKPISPVAEEDRPSSWQHMMTYAAGGAVQGYNENGSRKLQSPFGRHGGEDVMWERCLSGIQLSGTSTVRDNTQTDGFVETKTYGGKKPLANPRERNTLVKGPPGAFYRGLSRPKTNRSQSHDAERLPKVKVPCRQSSAKDYPTNSLRPLSLVASRKRDRPVTPINNIGPGLSEDTTPNDFVYRSPLAPPKRSSWQKLYTAEHLSEIREAAKADGIFDSQASQTAAPNAGLLRDSIKEAGSRKHLWEAPRLFQWNKEPSARTDLAQRKKMISSVVLGLCNLFPPLLLLLALGAMDVIISWWTSGETIAFGKGQKRLALILLTCWGAVTFTGLIIFVIYWFTTSHS
jgi:hypothetical protein